MTVGIMQPYLFPYIGYWQLLDAVDTFVVYDNIQFSKRGWFHRNNILMNGKKKLFSIPLKKDSDYLDVRDRVISDTIEKEISTILKQIESSYKKAPYFTAVFPMIKEIFQNDERNLFEYIYNSLTQISKYLDINTKIIISSTIDINHDLKSQDKVLSFNKVLDATQYINTIGGIELYEYEEFKKENIELEFLESNIPEYKQYGDKFVPYLSIIDIMMFNSKGDIKKMLKNYKLI